MIRPRRRGGASRARRVIAAADVLRFIDEHDGPLDGRYPDHPAQKAMDWFRANGAKGRASQARRKAEKAKAGQASGQAQGDGAEAPSPTDHDPGTGLPDPSSPRSK